MKMEIGPETKRQIVLKYKQKLKAALAEHEAKADDTSHMILLGDLIRLIEKEISGTSGSQKRWHMQGS